MAVAVTPSFVRIAIADGAASETFDFAVESGAHVRVRFITEADPDPDWLEGAAYAVTLSVPGPGGVVAFTPALEGAGVIEIERATPRTQGRRFTNIGRFPEEAVEGGLDRAALVAQELDERGQRALTLPRGLAFSGALPAPVAGGVPRIKGDLSGLEFIDSADIEALAAIVDEIVAVAALEASMNSVLAVSDEIVAVAAINAEIAALGPIAAAIAGVNAISADVSTAAANISAIQNASTHATNAATNASNAASSASDAADEADSAAASATAAASSQTAAAGSASAAAGSASAASTSAGNAATSATNAGNSATAAAASATTATTQAGAASTSAGNAATSEANAATSETNAGNSASAAATSATNAANSATAAGNAQTAAETAQSAAEDAADTIEQAISGYTWAWDTGTADADPGAGELRANNADLSLVTFLYVSETDSLGASVPSSIDSWDDSTSTTRAFVTIKKRSNPVNQVMYAINGAITDAGAYRKVPVQYIAHAGSFSAADILGLVVERTGDKGESGEGSGDMLIANALSELAGAASTARGNIAAAPNSPDFLVKTANGELTGERVVTDTATVAVDWATAGQAKFGVVPGSIGATQLADAGVTLAKMANVATDRLIGRDTASSGAPEELTVGGGIEFSGAGGIRRSALTGDVTASAGSGATTIANDAVTYAKMQNVATNQRVLGRTSGAGGDVEELAISALLDWIGTGRGALLYRGAAGWAAVAPGTAGYPLISAGAGADPAYGQVGTGGLADGAVTLAKVANIATARLLGRNTGGTGVVEELAPATVRAMLDLEAGTDFLAYSAFHANGISLVGMSYASMRAALDLEAGTDFYSKSAMDTLLGAKVSSDPTGVSGADQVTNMMSLTTAEYGAIGAPNSSTLYLITDA